ncbi:MAG: aromatic amino acid transport family protein [Minisyncoccales bacterium]
MKDFLKALAVFVGTIIGVGIFGLPYVVSKAGFFIALFYFLLISGIAIGVNLIFGEICLGTKGLHRLPGYVSKYLGTGWKNLSFLLVWLGLTGASLAYLIVGGEFLKFLFAPYFGGSNLIYTLIFFGVGSYLIFRGIKSISQIELSLLFIFFAVLIIFFLKALPFINIDYLKTIDWRFLAFPYGVILFSLWGSAIVPELKEILKGDRKKLKKVIISGVLIASIAYIFFVFIIFGTCGTHTSKEAISGFSQTLGNNIIGLGFIFGIIACFTSFLTLGLTLKKVFWYDFRLSKNFSWVMACFLPLFLFLAGMREFINVIAITGAIAIGGEGIIIIFLYRAFLKKKFSQKMNPLLYFLPIFFVIGMGLQIFYFMFAK